MIASQDDRHYARLQSFDNQLRLFGAGGCNLFQILRVRIADFLLFRDGHRDIARIFDDVAELLEASLKPRNANRGGSHVHAAPRLPKIKWHAYDANLLRADAHVGDVCGHEVNKN